MRLVVLGTMLLGACALLVGIGASLCSPIDNTDDWARARCFEFITRDRQSLHWKTIGPNRWYFEEADFGARLFNANADNEMLVICPSFDGFEAYALVGRERLFKTPGLNQSADYGAYWPFIDAETRELDSEFLAKWRELSK